MKTSSNTAGCIHTPFDGFPITRQIAGQDGNPVFIVSPRTLTPLRAKIADALGTASTLSLAAGCLFYLQTFPIATNWAIAGLLATPLLAYPLFTAIWRFLLKTKTRIVLTPSSFKFKAGRDWQAYDRTLPHGFAVLAHDKAQTEAKRHDHLTRLAQAEGEIISPKSYYGQAFHLCLIYAGQRVDITTIYGRKEASAILARLQLCDGVLDTACGINGATTLSPGDEITRQPGDLPAA